MDRKQELLEAKAASERLLLMIDQATEQLRKAKNWGIWDLLGGGMIASLLKRSRMKEANETMRQLSVAMKNFLDEIDDVDVDFAYQLDDSSFDNFFDVWFDNIFTDIRVQGQIGDKLAELGILRDKVRAIDNQLGAELATYE